MSIVWGCTHERTTFPQTRKRRELVTGIERPAGTFVQCLDCGAELAYSWQEMRILSDRERRKRAKEALA